jgi:hypothetical protein
LIWHKKFQLCLVYNYGKVEFIEYTSTYNSSNSTFNHRDLPELAYTAVVDGNTINLTPLGKFLMPPPMFEKQVILPAFANCLSMYGHQVLAYSHAS